MKQITIYADESCLGNGTAGALGGAAGLVEIVGPHGITRRDYWLSDAPTTNNRMAIASAFYPLSRIEEPAEILLVSDSTYLVNGINTWLGNWVRSGKLARGKVPNFDIWRALLRHLERHVVRCEWVRGHNGHTANEYADFLAQRAAREQSMSAGLVPSEFAAWATRRSSAGAMR